MGESDDESEETVTSEESVKRGSGWLNVIVFVPGAHSLLATIVTAWVLLWMMNDQEMTLGDKYYDSTVLSLYLLSSVVWSVAAVPLFFKMKKMWMRFVTVLIMFPVCGLFGILVMALTSLRNSNERFPSGPYSVVIMTLHFAYILLTQLRMYIYQDMLIQKRKRLSTERPRLAR